MEEVLEQAGRGEVTRRLPALGHRPGHDKRKTKPSSPRRAELAEEKRACDNSECVTGQGARLLTSTGLATTVEGAGSAPGFP